MKSIIFKDLGLIDYQEAFLLQEQLLQEAVKIKIYNRNLTTPPIIIPKNNLLFLEHPHVYTLGKSGDNNNLLADPNKLKSINAIFIQTNRGGDITYHGPGQLIGYPILDLDQFFTDIHKFLRLLEEVIIKTIADYGLNGQRSVGETGVWLDVGKPYARKICAMGVKTTKWITMHGFGLNVNTDLRYFDHIIPCGIKDKAVTSLARELGKAIEMSEVKEKVKIYFSEVFNVELK